MARDVTLSSAALSNLLSLSNTSSLIDRTQTRLSTGKAVNSALDDAQAFFKSRGFTDRASDLTSIKSNINNGLNVVKTATDSLDQVLSFLTQAKAAANSAAAEKDANIRATYVNQINETLGKLVDLAADANYDGINLIQAVADIEETSPAGVAAVAVVDAPGSAFEAARRAQVVTTDSVTAALNAGVGSNAFAVTGSSVTTATLSTVAGEIAQGFAAATAAAGGSLSNVAAGTPLATTDTSLAVGDILKGADGSFWQVAAFTTDAGNAATTYTKIDLAATVTAVAAGYTTAQEQTDLAAAVTAAAGSPGALRAANKAVLDFNNARQDAINLEVRSNPAIYQDMEGFTQPDTLSVVFSEQDRNRRLDVQATALGDLLTGIVRGVSTVAINAADWTALDGKNPNTQAITDFTAKIDAASRQVRAYAAQLGNYSNILSVRDEFTANTINTLKGGSADLVNADLNQESANMLALQTRQQLGVIALSIAQQSEQSVLRLF